MKTNIFEKISNDETLTGLQMRILASLYCHSDKYNEIIISKWYYHEMTLKFKTSIRAVKESILSLRKKNYMTKIKNNHYMFNPFLISDCSKDSKRFAIMNKKWDDYMSILINMKKNKTIDIHEAIGMN